MINKRHIKASFSYYVENLNSTGEHLFDNSILDKKKVVVKNSQKNQSVLSLKKDSTLFNEKFYVTFSF